MQTSLFVVLAGLGLGACAVDAHTETHQSLDGEADQVAAWNKTAMAALASQNPLYQTRFMSIIQAAVFDAVNAVEGGYEPYAFSTDAPDDATANAAAAGAAYYALKHMTYAPPLTAAQQALIQDAWDNLPASIRNNAGIAVGEQAAAAILGIRSTDNAPIPPLSPYTAPGSGNPGVWVAQNNAPALGVTWGNVDTWVLNDVTQFYPEAPPALDSELYLADLAEVRAVGASTQDPNGHEANVSRFWITTAPIIFNPIARDLAAHEGLSQIESARLLAAMNIAGADAAINCWHVKFKTNFWRPITAIRTTVDPTWSPLLANPPFPEYVSGHAEITTAMTAVLADQFGNAPGTTFVGRSPTASPGFVRNWSTFDEVVDEVIDARVWSGIHFRFSNEVGSKLGRQIAQYVNNHTLRAQRGHRNRD